MSSQNPKQQGVVSSFRKKGTHSVNIRGTRVSTQNALLLTSTGSPTLDFFIGGGIAIGTIFLIEEDHFNTYSGILLKYYLAEGFASKHKLFLSSGNQPSKQILKEIPSVKVPEAKSTISNNEESSEDNLKIAWRYQGQSNPKDFANIRMDSQNHGYDLSQPISEQELSECEISTWDPEESDETITNIPYSNFLDYHFTQLLNKLKSELTQYRTTLKTCDNILRIGICSLGSPLWTAQGGNNSVYLLRFLYALKSLLRTSFAVAVITVPTYVTKNKVLQSRIHQICDTVVCLESFVGSDKQSSPLFKEYDGLLHVVKLPVLNTFVYPVKVSDLAFKLKRQDFIIERLHLPPDFEDAPTEASYGCSGQPSKLDF